MADSKRDKQDYIALLVQKHLEDTHPWDRLPGEPAEGFQIFAALRDMMPEDRKVTDACRSIGLIGEGQAAPAQYYHLAKRWRWPERLWAYDVWQDKKVQREWANRRAEQREKEWSLAKKIYTVAEEMLEKAEEGLDGVSWRASDIPKLAETASKLARLAAEMEIGTVKLDVQELDKKVEEALKDYYIALKRAGREEDVLDGEFAELAGLDIGAEIAALEDGGEEDGAT